MSEMSKYIEMDNSARYQCLDRYIELSEKILKKDDAQTRYKGLSNLINDINLKIPDVIELCAPLYPEATNFRFNHFVTDVWLHSGMMDNEFFNCLFLLNHHRKDIEEYEADNEDKRKERNAKLEQYAQTVRIELPNYEVHPDIIYCQMGIYRKYRRYYRTACFRMGRLIQTSDLVVGDLKTTMYLVLLYWALSNERAMVADELTMMGVAVPSANRHMEWCDLSELREAASSYYRLLKSYSFAWNDQDTNARVSRLHDAIANVKVDEIGDVLERFNVNQSTIINEVENIISIVEYLIDEIGMKMPEVKPFDPGVAEVFKFCNELRSVMTIELTKLRDRLKTDLTMGDEKAGQRLMSYLDGDYNDMDFQLFYNNYLIPDGDYYPDTDFSTIIHARRRRLIYLIGICTDDEVKDIMIELLRGVQHEIDVHNNAVPEPEQPTPSAGNEQAAEATDTPDMALPDFSHMKSYTPTIAFDMSALYSFLVTEKVIENIDEKLFGNCIEHAHMNEVWNVGNHHKLKCVYRHLKDHFTNDWIDVVAERMSTTRKIITAFDRSKIRDFEMRLTDII